MHAQSTFPAIWIRYSFLLLIFLTVTMAGAQNIPGRMNFQAVLTDTEGTPLSGTLDITFAIFDAPTGGTLLWSEQQTGISISDEGVLNVQLGNVNAIALAVFGGGTRYLEMTIAGDTPMSPRSPLVTVPYAFIAAKSTSIDGATGGGILGSMDISDGLVVGGILRTSGFKLGDATVPGHVLTVDDNGVGTWQAPASWGADAWLLLGNAGTSVANNFLGTTDNTPVAFKVNNERFLRANPIPTGLSFYAEAPSIIGGHSSNNILASVSGAFIGGGGGHDADAGVDYPNTVTSHFGAIVGGQQNTVSGFLSFIGGGYDNTVSGQRSVISGGYSNTASGDHATVPGGFDCAAGGNYSLAAGRRAKANHDGCFVWADNTDQDFPTQDVNQFKVRAANGVVIGGGGTDGLVKIYDATPSEVITLDAATGTVTTEILEITGGMDVAEPFSMSEEYPLGSVVVIDPDNSGKLTISTAAYDAKVAGIISGANGINPGLTLSQQGVRENGQFVALTGRVYCLASAENGPITPGDLLTSASLPGHAMKATDRIKSHGAVLGKAMSSLDQGTGYVLVLVNLH